MNDKQFQKELDKLALLNEAYKTQLGRMENEIKKRYGFFPSDVDCDYWIDTFHVGIGDITVRILDEQMKWAISINQPRGEK